MSEFVSHSRYPMLSLWSMGREVTIAKQTIQILGETKDPLTVDFSLWTKAAPQHKLGTLH